jgi:hypothetical protein
MARTVHPLLYSRGSELPSYRAATVQERYGALQEVRSND